VTICQWSMKKGRLVGAAHFLAWLVSMGHPRLQFEEECNHIGECPGQSVQYCSLTKSPRNSEGRTRTCSILHSIGVRETDSIAVWSAVCVRFCRNNRRLVCEGPHREGSMKRLFWLWPCLLCFFVSAGYADSIKQGAEHQLLTFVSSNARNQNFPDFSQFARSHQDPPRFTNISAGSSFRWRRHQQDPVVKVPEPSSWSVLLVTVLSMSLLLPRLRRSY
jgi:hypothetical protein